VIILQDAPELLLNIGVGSAAYYYLLREQNKAEPQQLEATSSYHFLAFFISGKTLLSFGWPFFLMNICTAGLFSGLVSHVVNTKFRYPKMVAQLASPASNIQKTETWAAAVAASSASAAQAAAVSKLPPILPSLGASGAVYAAATMTALAFPESQVALFIPPTYPINIQYGIGGLMMVDVIGILRGWRSVFIFFIWSSQLNTWTIDHLIIGHIWGVLLSVLLIINLGRRFGIAYEKHRQMQTQLRSIA